MSKRENDNPAMSRLSYRAQLAALYLMAAVVLTICWWVAR